MIDGAGSLANTLFLPWRFYRMGIRVVGEKMMRDDQAILVDENGRVHTFKYVGMILRPGEPGYEWATTAEERESDD